MKILPSGKTELIPNIYRRPGSTCSVLFWRERKNVSNKRGFSSAYSPLRLLRLSRFRVTVRALLRKTQRVTCRSQTQVTLRTSNQSQAMDSKSLTRRESRMRLCCCEYPDVPANPDEDPSDRGTRVNDGSGQAHAQVHALASSPVGTLPGTL
jgi:hypothetical protein